MTTQRRITSPPKKSLYVNKTYFIELGGGSAGVAGAASGQSSQRTIPEFPGWDPSKCPGKGYEWRGKGERGSKAGSWHNPETGEWLRADLDHPDPIEPHWDYGRRGGDVSYRIFPDGSYSPKLFDCEGAIIK